MSAEAGGRDFLSTPDDVIQAFRLFFGREADSSAAIRERLDLGFGPFIGHYVTAQEFLLNVLKPIAERTPLPHILLRPRPDATLALWAADRLPLSPAGAEAARKAVLWSELLGTVLADPTFLAALPPEYAAVVARSLEHARRTAEAPHAPRIGTAKELIGAIEYHGGSEIRGWAANARDPAETLFLEFYVDELYIGAVRCALYRRDLAESLGGEGSHGFVFTVPAAYLPLLKTGSRVVVKEAVTKQRIARDLLLQYDDVDFSDFAERIAGEFRDVKQTLARLERSLPVLGRLATSPLDQYDGYRRTHYVQTARALRAMEEAVAAMARRPLVTLCLHVGAGGLTPAQAAGLLASLADQPYPEWEALVLCDSATVPEDEVAILRSQVESGVEAGRIAVLAAPAPGMAQALGHLAGRWRGEVVGLVGQPLRLAPDALVQVARAVLRSGPLLVYGDHDEMRPDRDGEPVFDSPVLKPAFDYQMLLSYNYVGGLFFMAAEPLAALCADLPEEGDCAYALLLAFAARFPQGPVRHLPRVLHHLLRPEGSEPLLGTGRSLPRDRAVVERHLARRGIAAAVAEITVPASPLAIPATRVDWPLPDPAPTVSVIVPTKDRFLLIAPCFESLVASRSRYPGTVEIVIVDHESTCQETVAFLNAARAVQDVAVLGYAGAFNWAAINNFAVRHARGEVLVFLNNDMTVISPDWCRELVSCALLPEVGAVGARLLYEDGTYQHAGVVLGVDGGAIHEHAGEAPTAGGYLGRTEIRHATSAVTGACLATRRPVFEAVGGFDAMNLKVTFNDVDYCLKLRERGLEVVYTPFASFYHFESRSRGFDITFEKQERARAELETLRRRWPERIARDPFYNAHFSRHARPFARLGPPPDPE